LVSSIRAVGSLNQLRRDPHVLGWFIDLRLPELGARGLHRTAGAYALHTARARLEMRNFPIWPI
jgi:hypothetical protein